MLYFRKNVIKKGELFFMWSRAELKLKAKESLSYFFGKGLAVCVILVSISFAVRRLYNFLMSMFGVNGAAQKNYVDYIVNYIRYGSKYAGYTEKTPTMGAIIFAVVLMLLYYAYIYFIYEPMEIGVSRFYQRSRGITTSVSEMFSPLDYSPRIAGCAGMQMSGSSVRLTSPLATASAFSL